MPAATPCRRTLKAVAMAAAALTAFVAVSRVYVGVHYPSDVVGGVGMGLLLTSGWHSVARLRSVRRALR